VRPHRGRQLLGLDDGMVARRGQLGHGGAGEAVDLLELEVVAAQALEPHQRQPLRRGLGGTLRPARAPRPGRGRGVEPIRHEPELRTEVGLAPDAEAEEVVERPAQDLGIAVELGHRHRAPPLLDGHLGRSGQSQLLGDDGLCQAEELARLRDALTDLGVRLHVWLEFQT